MLVTEGDLGLLVRRTERGTLNLHTIIIQLNHQIKSPSTCVDGFCLSSFVGHLPVASAIAVNKINMWCRFVFVLCAHKYAEETTEFVDFAGKFMRIAKTRYLRVYSCHVGGQPTTTRSPFRWRWQRVIMVVDGDGTGPSHNNNRASLGAECRGRRETSIEQSLSGRRTDIQTQLE